MEVGLNALLVCSILQKPVSIKDIARAANVSYSRGISRALQNSPLVFLSKTTEIMQQIAEQSHYRPSAVAR